MGLYIHPTLRVVTEGVMMEEVPSTYDDARNQLRKDEHLAAVANRPHGPVALLIASQADFDHVRQVGCEAMFIIDSDLADRAR